MIRLTYLFMFFSLSLNADGDKPPQLDLRNFNDKINNLSSHSMNSLIFEGEDENSIYILDHQIDAIKLKSSQYIPGLVKDDDLIFIYTNLGILKFNFFLNDSPNHCFNFKKLANSKFYDKTLFHNVIPNFIVQGGDILTRNSDRSDDGQGGPGWAINAEYNQLKHVEGTLSMFRTQNDPNSAGSQFFISLSKNKSLDSKYTIFAHMVNGKHILSRISNVTSENGQAKLLCKNSLPTSSQESEWVELWDPITKNILYSKIQGNVLKSDYKQIMQERLDNMFRPGTPIIIDSIRISNEK